MQKVDVVEAFKMRMKGCTYQEIADVYGVTKQYIHQLLTGAVKEKNRGLAKCIYPGLKMWFMSTGTTVDEMNNKLSLCGERCLLYHRLQGKTNFTIREIKAILQYTGMTFEEAFGEETSDV